MEIHIYLFKPKKRERERKEKENKHYNFAKFEITFEPGCSRCPLKGYMHFVYFSSTFVKRKLNYSGIRCTAANLGDCDWTSRWGHLGGLCTCPALLCFRFQFCSPTPQRPRSAWTQNAQWGHWLFIPFTLYNCTADCAFWKRS